jgi:hypothetical protein
MNTISFPIESLRAVMLAMPAKDRRYYLNGVLVETAADTSALVATDGHRLHCVTLGTPGVAPAQFIIPADMLAAVVKGAKKGSAVTVTATPRETGGYELELARDDGLSVRGFSVDGTFPDWRRVVPKPVAPEDARPAQFNYEFLADAQKAAGLVAGVRRCAVLHVAHSADGFACLATCADADNFFAVIMPIRDDKAQPGGRVATAYATCTNAPSREG